MRQILAMGAFAGAFLAAVGAAVTWHDELMPVRAVQVARVHSPVAAVLPTPSPSDAALPSPAPSPTSAPPVPAPSAASGLVAGARPATTRPAAPKPSGVVVGSYQQTLINQDRTAAGLPPLTWSSCRAGVA
jgi:uncharacterized protein YkwD